MPFSLLEAVRSSLVGFSSWLANRLPRLGFQGKLPEAPRKVFFRISDPYGNPFEWDGEKAWLSREGIARAKRKQELLIERASEAREARRIEASLKALEDDRRRLIRMLPTDQVNEEIGANGSNQENSRSALARIRSSLSDADSQLATLKRQDVEEGVFCGEELGGDNRVSGERGVKDKNEGLSGAGGVMFCSNPEDPRFLTERLTLLR